MAIIIPSKNIYEMTNEKIVKNKISSIGVNTLSFLESTNLSNSLFSYSSDVDKSDLFIEDGTYPDGIGDKFDKVDSDSRDVSEPGAVNTTLAYALCAIKAIYEDLTVKFVKNADAYTLNENKVKLSNKKVVCDVITKDTSQKYTGVLVGNDVYYMSGDTIVTTSNTIEDETFEDFSLSVSASAYYNSVNANISLDNEETLILENLEVTEDNYYVAKLKILIGKSVLVSEGTVTGLLDVGSTHTRYGTITEYRPKSFEFNLMGQTFQLNKSETAVYVTGDNIDGSPISISSNSLFQKEYEEEAKIRVDKIIGQYANGKETATVVCSISDYADENGSKLITADKSSGKMSFKLHDEVIPCVRNEYGTDSPMSMTPDGLVKSFSVLGSEMFYDGSVSQRLSLQEANSYNIQISDGTQGLVYSLSEDGSYLICAGIGPAIGNDIKVATTVNGKVVTELAEGVFASSNDIINKITIPLTISKLPMEAFRGSSELRMVILPNTITEIGELAFYQCYNLRSIKFPSSLKSIKDNAFNGCNSLINISIPNVIIGSQAFANCQGLRTVNLTSGIFTIANDAFINCPNLTDIYISVPKYEALFEGAPWGATNATIHYNNNFEHLGYTFISTAYNSGGSPYSSGDGHRFIVQGVGNVFINDNYWLSVNSPNERIDIYARLDEGFARTLAFSFVGDFSEVSSDYYSTTNSSRAYSNIKEIINWDGKMRRTYTYMFRLQTIDFQLKIPRNYTTISTGTFNAATSTQRIIIPSNIKTIERMAFNGAIFSEIEFSHGVNDTIALPAAGSIDGMFYYKNSRNMTIYTDNEKIKNYNWTADNIVPTFYHLDGTAWE